MLKFNLLQEPESIRSTVTRHTPVPGKRILNGKIIILMTLAVLSVAVWATDQNGGTSPTPQGKADTRKTGSQLAGRRHATNPATKPAPARPAVAKPLADKKTPADDERKKEMADAEKFSTPVRPVAHEAARTRLTRRHHKVWSVRFGLCRYRESCRDIVKELKKKGIRAELVSGRASLPVRRVIAGPWPTAEHVRQATVKLAQAGTPMSVLSSGSRFYLVSEPFTSEGQAKATLARIRGIGYPAKSVLKREPKKVYKIFGGFYKTRELAHEKTRVYLKHGIDCIVEQRDKDDE